MNLATFVNSSLMIGSRRLNNRLIQGPLAGYSCAPFRGLTANFMAAGYSVSEMLSAHDVLYKHIPAGRYLYRAPAEEMVCYQIAGYDPLKMAAAAKKLARLGADLIDINCGCPKAKIRKKGAGSALLEHPAHLLAIIKTVRAAISIPLTVKVRLSAHGDNVLLAQQIEQAGADALIIHPRRWLDDYDIACDWAAVNAIKKQVSLPVIINGDICDSASLANALTQTGADAAMISRAATGKPWLFAELLKGTPQVLDKSQKLAIFMHHLHGLAALENPYKAVLQSKSLVRYYFRAELTEQFLQNFYALLNLADIETQLSVFLANLD